MRISIVVPVYNVKEYLTDFIHTLKNQTRKDFETILVDDGSTDGTSEVLDNLVADAPSADFKIFHKENGGCADAWLFGLRYATGTHITFADPDDLLSPDLVETYYDILREHDPDVIMIDMNKLSCGRLSNDRTDFGHLQEGLYTGDALENIKGSIFGKPGSPYQLLALGKVNKLFNRRLIYDNLGFTDKRIGDGEDVCLSVAAILDCKSFYYTHRSLYTYRIRPSSITNSAITVDKMNNLRLLIDAVFNLMTEKGRMTDYIRYAYPAQKISYLLAKINNGNDTEKNKKSMLRDLSSHGLTADYDIKKAKRYLNLRRYVILRLLKKKRFGLLMRLMHSKKKRGEKSK